MTSEWKEISEAPKDGTRVLLYGIDCGDEGTACYHLAIGSFNSHPLRGEPYWRGVSHPTHWMPLPNPPIKEGES